MQSATPSRIALLVSCLGALFAVGCETNYTSLRFRPVDTSSQLVLEDVRITVSRDNAQPVERAKTNENGHAELTGLKAGDILTFSKDGYEPAVLTLEASAYRQRSPSSSASSVRFDLRDLDAVPIPLHRTGQIVHP